jgi:CheY-like chemotaxis protein
MPTVLLVDDKPEILTTLMRFLALKGYDVEIAKSVPEAIPLIEQKRFDAAILDLRLPPHSGLELLQLIRENEALRDMPAVILTGANLTKEEQITLARYRGHVFYKPRSYEALIKHLDKALGR